MDELRRRSDWSEGMFADATIRDDRIAERQVPSYLWERWKSTLSTDGYDWQAFQRDVSAASWLVQAWTTGDATWGEVLERVERAIEVEIE